MRRIRLGCLGIAVALLLACGCSQATSPLEQQVSRIVAASGARLVTGISVYPDPDKTVVRMRVDGADVGFTEAGRGDASEPFIGGGALVGDWNYQSISEALTAGQAQCAADPVVHSSITVTGAQLTETLCGDTSLTTTLDGVDVGPAEIDLETAEGIDQLLTEATAMMPNSVVYQIVFPGPAAEPGQPAVAVGRPWTSADGERCHLRFQRNPVPDGADEVRWYRCSEAEQEGGSDSQEVFHPSDMSGETILEAQREAVAASGIPLERVRSYILAHPWVEGTSIIVIGTDDQTYVHPFDP